MMTRMSSRRFGITGRILWALSFAGIRRTSETAVLDFRRANHGSASDAATRPRGVPADRQYLSIPSSTSTDQASIPPPRLMAPSNPWAASHWATIMERTPWWQ